MGRGEEVGGVKTSLKVLGYRLLTNRSDTQEVCCKTSTFTPIRGEQMVTGARCSHILIH